MKLGYSVLLRVVHFVFCSITVDAVSISVIRLFDCI